MGFFSGLGKMLGGNQVKSLTAPKIEQSPSAPTLENPGNIGYTKSVTEKAEKLGVTGVPEELSSVTKEWVENIRKEAEKSAEGAELFEQAIQYLISLGNSYDKAHAAWLKFMEAASNQGLTQYEAQANFFDAVINNQITMQGIDINRAGQARLGTESLRLLQQEVDESVDITVANQVQDLQARMNLLKGVQEETEKKENRKKSRGEIRDRASKYTRR